VGRVRVDDLEESRVDVVGIEVVEHHAGRGIDRLVRSFWLARGST